MIAIFIKKLYRKSVINDSILVRMTKALAGIIKKTYGSEKYGSDKDIKKCYIRKVWMDVIITIVVFILAPLCIFNLDDMVMFIGYGLIAFYIFYIYHSIKEYKYLRLFNKVNLNIDYLYHGMYEYVDREDTSEIMMKLANLSQGFKNSVAKQIEAEKLQVELITNVSHDLKTPLTSIISYVDLLSKEELPAVASDYVKILIDKSDRLKSIVSDVFDLAKAASGEEIEMESLDGMILVNQVLSDMDDAIKASGREIKLKADIETAPITGNGQKLYRVFQNVIGNALKYSMPGTRIFVNANIYGNDFVFIIKNVSEFEIDFTEEEILSRFVRGDKARHSEGNGLGLSIAKSFTEQCGGSFAVSLDDDMFKVIIRLR
jgi:signal transduction histidine kinase